MKFKILTRYSMIVAFALVVVSLPPRRAFFQEIGGGSTLPPDLFFTVDAVLNNSEESIIYRLNFTDNTRNAFFLSEGPDGIYILDWLPESDLLAVMLEVDAVWQYCLITPQGELASCLNAQMSDYGFINSLKAITWSVDEEFVYVLSEENRIFSLVELDLSTGEVNRNLYQHPRPYNEIPPQVTWDHTENFVHISYTDTEPSGEFLYESVVNLETGDEINVTEQFSSSTEHAVLCHHFSPVNSYMTIATVPTGGSVPSRYIVVDMQGNTIAEISTDAFNDDLLMLAGCPRWAPDEQSFFIAANENRFSSFIWEYDFDEQDWVREFKLPQDTPGSWFYVTQLELPAPVIPSEQGTHLAMTFLSTLPAERAVTIYVLFPDDEIERVSDSYAASNPIWLVGE